MAAAKPKTHRTTKPKPKTPAARTKGQAKIAAERSSLRREIYGVLMGAISLLLLLSLVSHVPSDAEKNWVGKTGHFIAEGVFFLFGLGAFVTVVLTAAIAVWLLFGRQKQLRPGGVLGGALVMLSLAALFSVLLPNLQAWDVPLGGWIGTAIGGSVMGVLGGAGAVLVLLSTTVVGAILITRSSFVEATSRAVRRVRETSEDLQIGDRATGAWSAVAGATKGLFARKQIKEAPPLDMEDDEAFFEDDDDDFSDDFSDVDDDWSDTEAPSASMRTLQEIASSVEAARTVAPRAAAASPPKAHTADELVESSNAPSLTFGERAASDEAPAPIQVRRKEREDFEGQGPVQFPVPNQATPSSEASGAAARARQALQQFRQGERGRGVSAAHEAVDVAMPEDDRDAMVATDASTAAAAPSWADAERIRAQMHHPIHNPMANTTRQNAPIASELPRPLAAAASGVLPPAAPAHPAPVPSELPPAFGAAIAASEHARAAAVEPPTAAPALRPVDVQRTEVEERSPQAPRMAVQAPARSFEASPPVEIAEPQRLATDIGIEDVEPTEVDPDVLDLPPPILRPAAADGLLADASNEGMDEVGATAPHRILWPDPREEVLAQARATRPVDPLDDDDFDFEPDDLPEEPEIIESPAQQDRMSCEKMERALRSMAAERANSSWEYPSLDALRYEESTTEIDEDGLREMATMLVEAFADYKVKGRVIGICPGPVVTRFEFEPEPGTKLSRISGLSTDIAMRLRAENVRIIAPIPGKGCVGVEVPNDIRETVYLKEILADRRFIEARSKLTMALGKDIEGFPVVADLAKMPHLLVAGTTGSGKSVSVNAMIMSILFNASPDEVRLILIDPKQLEFALYEDVPHLLLPVVTDPNKAATALQWAVDDMERRYRLMKELRVRNIEGYNQKILQLQAELEDEQAGRGKASSFALRTLAEEDMDGRPRHRHMPYIIVVVDEFADLIMAAGKDVEIAVARLAQKARAAGIHCILATQRPSVDVLTGTIKSNFPTRISFRLISGTDSRTVIDTQGAENLLGMGDMLYRPPGSSDLVRVHGAFIDEDEIERVVDFIKDQREVEYDETILAAQISTTDDDEELDPKFEEAVDVCVEAGFASISMIQRRLSVGYNRAANIVEEMERRGIVGPSSGGASRREVLISR